MRNWMLFITAALCCGLASGCMDAISTVAVEKDGSGTITQEVYMRKEVQAMIKQQAAAMAKAMGGEAPEDDGDEFEVDEEELKAKAAELGEGVTFVKAEAVENKRGDKGHKVVYAFEDVTKIRLNPNPEPPTPGGAAGPGGQPKEFVTFGFEKGDASTLTVKLPDMDEKMAENAEKNPSPPDPAQLQQMKMFFDGFRVRVRVSVDGKITETNATYPNRSKTGLTLIDMNIGKLVADEKQFKKFAETPPPKSVAEAKEAMADMDGIRMELENPVTVTFK